MVSKIKKFSENSGFSWLSMLYANMVWRRNRLSSSYLDVILSYIVANLVTIAIMYVYLKGYMWLWPRLLHMQPCLCSVSPWCPMTSKPIMRVHQSACSVVEVIFEFPAIIFVARDMILCWKKKPNQLFITTSQHIMEKILSPSIPISSILE